MNKDDNDDSSVICISAVRYRRKTNPNLPRRCSIGSNNASFFRCCFQDYWKMQVLRMWWQCVGCIRVAALVLTLGMMLDCNNINRNRHGYASAQTTFNLQVMERVNERLNDFMSIPVDIAKRASLMRKIGGFPHKMEAPDRYELLQFLYIHQPSLLYFGLEDGTFLLFDVAWNSVSYREPGEGGYDAIKVPEDKAKYLDQCVDSFNGTATQCLLEEEQLYIQCVNNCELVPCQQLTSNCTSSNRTTCLYEDSEAGNISTTKWCKNYQVVPFGPNDTPMGFIPRTKSCIDSNGMLSQTPGEVVSTAFPEMVLGNCYYKDGITLVNRQVVGPYAHCQKQFNQQIDQKQQRERYLEDTPYPFVRVETNSTNKTEELLTTTVERCNNTFVGGFQSSNYDPRFRGWYMLTKKEQQAVWTDPYPFFAENDIGITYSEPIYDTIISPNGNTTSQLFTGVIAVDYYLRELRDFLKSQYSGTDMLVLVVEYKEPHYVMAASTGSPSTKYILRNDTTKPCPYENKQDPGCDIIRIPVSDLEGHPMDLVLKRAFYAQRDAGFPSGQLVNVKEADNIGAKAYFSQGQPYKQLTAKNLEWHVVVVMPIERSQSDSAVRGDTLFIVVCMFGFLGVSSCFTLCVLFFRKRNEAAVRYADWRFTSAFILGCSALNLSSFTLLGENTYPTCLLRMWSFNSLFVCALAPLLVKVWRMYKILMASATFRRVNVTHFQAFMYTLPFIVTELVILTIFSFVDRPRPVEDLSSGQQTITCQQNTEAFFATQVVYDGCLVLVGCILAYKTRDVDPQYGEAKQLVFSMYNVAFTGFVLVLIFNLVELDQNSKIVLQAVGVLWGTFFCSFAFVLPRLLEVRNTNLYTLRRTVPARNLTSSTQFSHVGIIIAPEETRPKSKGKIGARVRFEGDDNSETDKPLAIESISSRIDEILEMHDGSNSSHSKLRELSNKDFDEDDSTIDDIGNDMVDRALPGGGEETDPVPLLGTLPSRIETSLNGDLLKENGS